MSRLPEWNTAGKMRRQILAIKRSDRLETRTIHSAKGREWDHVFVIGATEGLLPHYRATTKSALEEELNLMYVAVTRPRKQLTLMHSPYTYLLVQEVPSWKMLVRVHSNWFQPQLK